MIIIISIIISYVYLYCFNLIPTFQRYPPSLGGHRLSTGRFGALPGRGPSLRVVFHFFICHLPIFSHHPQVHRAFSVCHMRSPPLRARAHDGFGIATHHVAGKSLCSRKITMYIINVRDNNIDNNNH